MRRALEAAHARGGDAASMRLLDEADWWGWSPVHYAAQGGHARVLDTLLVAGASPSAATPAAVLTRGHVTPLHIAAKGGHVDAMEVLLHSTGGRATVAARDQLA